MWDVYLFYMYLLYELFIVRFKNEGSNRDRNSIFNVFSYQNSLKTHLFNVWQEGKHNCKHKNIVFFYFIVCSFILLNIKYSNLSIYSRNTQCGKMTIKKQVSKKISLYSIAGPRRSKCPWCNQYTCKHCRCPGYEGCDHIVNSLLYYLHLGKYVSTYKIQQTTCM